MFSFKKAVLNSFFKVETVSDTPGRLRLKIVHFKKLPKDAFEFESYAVELAAKLKGVISVSLNRTIGTVLVKYDPKKTDTKEILGNIDKVKETVLDNIDLINRANEIGIERTRDILINLFEEKLLEG